MYVADMSLAELREWEADLEAKLAEAREFNCRICEQARYDLEAVQGRISELISEGVSA